MLDERLLTASDHPKSDRVLPTQRFNGSDHGPGFESGADGLPFGML